MKSYLILITTALAIICSSLIQSCNSGYDDQDDYIKTKLEALYSQAPAANGPYMRNRIKEFNAKMTNAINDDDKLKHFFENYIFKDLQAKQKKSKVIIRVGNCNYYGILARSTILENLGLLDNPELGAKVVGMGKK